MVVRQEKAARVRECALERLFLFFTNSAINIEENLLPTEEEEEKLAH